MAVPARHLLPERPVETPEVLLHLTHVRQQAERRVDELLEPVADRRRLHQRHLAALQRGDLCVELCPPPQQLGETDVPVGLDAVRDLPEQLHGGGQSRLGADEGATGQRPDEGHGLLQRRGGLDVRFLRPRRVVLAQPARLGGSPVVHVGPRRSREGALAEPLVEGVEGVVEAVDQHGERQRPSVLLDVHLAQEGQDERRVSGAEQPPRAALLPQPLDVVVLHAPLLRGQEPRVGARADRTAAPHAERPSDSAQRVRPAEPREPREVGVP